MLKRTCGGRIKGFTVKIHEGKDTTFIVRHLSDTMDKIFPVFPTVFLENRLLKPFPKQKINVHMLTHPYFRRHFMSFFGKSRL